MFLANTRRCCWTSTQFALLYEEPRAESLSHPILCPRYNSSSKTADHPPERPLKKRIRNPSSCPQRAPKSLACRPAHVRDLPSGPSNNMSLLPQVRQRCGSTAPPLSNTEMNSHWRPVFAPSISQREILRAWTIRFRTSCRPKSPSELWVRDAMVSTRSAKLPGSTSVDPWKMGAFVSLTLRAMLLIL
ncbi:hypothetical protein VUR80DRAFT_4860 [Thermomyces stellatus]